MRSEDAYIHDNDSFRGSYAKYVTCALPIEQLVVSLVVCINVWHAVVVYPSSTQVHSLHNVGMLNLKQMKNRPMILIGG